VPEHFAGVKCGGPLSVEASLKAGTVVIEAIQKTYHLLWVGGDVLKYHQSTGMTDTVMLCCQVKQAFSRAIDPSPRHKTRETSDQKTIIV